MKGAVTVLLVVLVSLAFDKVNEDEVALLQVFNDYAVVEIESDWFDVSYVEPKTYVIKESESTEGNVSYLIIGADKAVMFDTGTGENPAEKGLKISHILDSLTSLPITLLLSHFHYDHNQNIAEFDKVAFPEIPFLQENVSADSIYEFSSEQLIVGTYPSEVTVSDWFPLETDIDLGDRVIQLVNVKGHAPESIAIIDKTNKLAFLGDFLYNGDLLLFDLDDLSLYEESLDQLISLLDNEYRLFGAHGKPEVAYKKLQKLKDFLRCIDKKKCQAINTFYFDFPVLEYSYKGMVISVFI